MSSKLSTQASSEVYTMTLNCDAFEHDLASLAELSKILPEAIDGLIHLVDGPLEFGKFTSLPTARANKFRILFQTSDRLVQLIAALRAANPHLLRAKELIQDTPPACIGLTEA